MRVLVFCVVALLSGSMDASSAADTRPIRFDAKGGQLFLSADDVARQMDFKFEVVKEGRLVTFCRQGKTEFCIPVQLSKTNHRVRDGVLLISAEVLRKTLDCDFKVERKQVVLTARNSTLPVDSPVKGYNEEWGRGRGFRVGDTLPDIPLIDLRGNEVRFGQFLGKRFILYCWASW